MAGPTAPGPTAATRTPTIRVVSARHTSQTPSRMRLVPTRVSPRTDPMGLGGSVEGEVTGAWRDGAGPPVRAE